MLASRRLEPRRPARPWPACPRRPGNASTRPASSTPGAATTSRAAETSLGRQEAAAPEPRLDLQLERQAAAPASSSAAAATTLRTGPQSSPTASAMSSRAASARSRPGTGYSTRIGPRTPPVRSASASSRAPRKARPHRPPRGRARRDRPMTVGIGLDDRHDRHARAGGIAQQRQVRREGIEVDLEPGGPGSGGSPASATRSSIGARAVRTASRRGPAQRGSRQSFRPTGRGRAAPAPLASANPSRLPAFFRSAIAGEALACHREAVGQVRGEQPGIAEPLAAGVAGQAVEVDTEASGVERRETLGEQRADRPGQHVAGPAGGEGRVLERCDRPRARPARR